MPKGTKTKSVSKQSRQSRSLGAGLRRRISSAVSADRAGWGSVRAASGAKKRVGMTAKARTHASYVRAGKKAAASRRSASL
jgi:hypothetical protein